MIGAKKEKETYQATIVYCKSTRARVFLPPTSEYILIHVLPVSLTLCGELHHNALL